MKAMNSSTTGQPIDKSILFNRTLYTAFVLLSIYYFFLNKDVANAMSNLGIALAFDPFDPKMAWDKRPRYQKLWLCAHLFILLILIGYLVFNYINR
ncbi:hypothetical protein BH09BAC3_BH09BAC3_09920 [soil metagenome]